MFNSYSEDFCHYAALTKPIDLKCDHRHTLVSSSSISVMRVSRFSCASWRNLSGARWGESKCCWERDERVKNLYVMDVGASKYWREEASNISFSSQYAIPFVTDSCHIHPTGFFQESWQLYITCKYGKEHTVYKIHNHFIDHQQENYFICMQHGFPMPEL